jgi:16S rRNA (guanine1516-N2)-methyltransferase
MPLVIANHCAWHRESARQLVESVRDLALEGEWRLEIDDRGLTLETRLHGQKTRLRHGFLEPALLRRAGQKNQGLLKACRNKRGSIAGVFDLTAGWGRDSFLLAASGLRVTLIEQQPLIAHCVRFLLRIAREDDEQSPCHRMELVPGNSLDWLTRSGRQADCLYLDPMFPRHKSGARPGKELQMLQGLTQNTDIEPLFEQALQSARQRVVVKRPLHAPPLLQREPRLRYREKTIRFDVYLPR